MSDKENFEDMQDFVKTESSLDVDFIPSASKKLKPRRTITNRRKRTSAPRRLQYEWNHNQIVHLIWLVEQHRELWDVESAEYKMSRLDGWRKVVDALNVKGIDVKEAKLKWMNLRLSFKTIMKKLRTQKPGEGTDESVSIKWRYFSLLKFLEADDVEQLTRTANITIDESISNDKTLEQPRSTITLRRKRRHTPPATPTPPDSPTPSWSLSTITTKQISTQVLSGALASLDRYDKHTIFGDFVASELRALPVHESDALRMALMRTVMTFLENRQTKNVKEKRSQLT